MTEHEHPLDYLDVPNRIRKRAQYESLTFELFETNVLVRNESHADPENHEYLVEIDNCLPISCTCPADEHYENACKHRVAVAMRRPIIDFASEANLIADGGTIRNEHSGEISSFDEQGAAEDDAEECDCTDLPDDIPCWECYRAGRKQFG